MSSINESPKACPCKSAGCIATAFSKANLLPAQAAPDCKEVVSLEPNKVPELVPVEDQSSEEPDKESVKLKISKKPVANKSTLTYDVIVKHARIFRKEFNTPGLDQAVKALTELMNRFGDDYPQVLREALPMINNGYDLEYMVGIIHDAALCSKHEALWPQTHEALQPVLMEMIRTEHLRKNGGKLTTAVEVQRLLEKGLKDNRKTSFVKNYPANAAKLDGSIFVAVTQFGCRKGSDVETCKRVIAEMFQALRVYPAEICASVLIKFAYIASKSDINMILAFGDSLFYGVLSNIKHVAESK